MPFSLVWDPFFVQFLAFYSLWGRNKAGFCEELIGSWKVIFLLMFGLLFFFFFFFFSDEAYSLLLFLNWNMLNREARQTLWNPLQESRDAFQVLQSYGLHFCSLF